MIIFTLLILDEYVDAGEDEEEYSDADGGESNLTNDLCMFIIVNVLAFKFFRNLLSVKIFSYVKHLTASLFELYLIFC